MIHLVCALALLSLSLLWLSAMLAMSEPEDGQRWRLTRFRRRQ